MKQYFSADVGAVGVSGLWQEAGQPPSAEGKVTGATRPLTPKSLNMETGAQPSVLQVTWVLTLGKLCFLQIVFASTGSCTFGFIFAAW